MVDQDRSLGCTDLLSAASLEAMRQMNHGAERMDKCRYLKSHIEEANRNSIKSIEAEGITQTDLQLPTSPSSDFKQLDIDYAQAQAAYLYER
jgi:hypothetical protein